MKIAFITEGSYIGKVSRNISNLRTDLAWQVALNSYHIPLNHVRENIIEDKYDLAIVIVPKTNPDVVDIEYIKSEIANCVAIMQEGPNWYWQDYSMESQINYFNNLMSCDFLLCHNKSDRDYYSGLTGKDVLVMPSLMIVDNILTDFSQENRRGVIVGGNLCSWYGGFDSYIISRKFEEKIYFPSMGRKVSGEESLPGVKHLPYMEWSQWITKLNQFKYAVHLMRTHAAGTFSLNTGYLGIPCIGYYGLDTQEVIHPLTTVDLGDLKFAEDIAFKLKYDIDFYKECSVKAKQNWERYYSEQRFVDFFMSKLIIQVIDNSPH